MKHERPCIITAYYCEKAPPPILFDLGDYDLLQDTARNARMNGFAKNPPPFDADSYDKHFNHSLDLHTSWSAVKHEKTNYGAVIFDEIGNHSVKAWNCIPMADLGALIRLPMPYDIFGGFCWNLPAPNGNLICRLCGSQIRIAILSHKDSKLCADFQAALPQVFSDMSPQTTTIAPGVPAPIHADLSLQGFQTNNPNVTNPNQPSGIPSQTKLLSAEEYVQMGGK